MIDRRTLDSAVAATLIAIGAAQFWGGLTMDRLEVRRIHPASIPGLLPIILGGVMVLLAVIIFISSRKQAHSEDPVPDTIGRSEIISFVWVSALCAVYALVLVGKLHFWLASSLFVGTFILIAERDQLLAGDGRRRLTIAALALAIAVIVPGAISFMFEEAFLVRLP